MTVIDAHLHLWDLSGGGYGWLGPQHGPLHRTFTAAEAAVELRAAAVDGAILVQADDTTDDTRAMLAHADAYDWVRGVVGWVRLDDPATAAEQLDDYGRHPALRGIRHLVHDDPRDDFLALAPVRESLRLVAARGLTLDVPDAWPRHLDQLTDLLDAVDGLTVVVDHLGKPPRGTDAMAPWEEHLRTVARHPRAVAKLSGLQMPGRPSTADALRPVLDVALDAFGPDRLMYGSDWPMTIGDGGYARHRELVSTLLDPLSADERDAVLAGTARRVYGLDTPDGGDRDAARDRSAAHR